MPKKKIAAPVAESLPSYASELVEAIKTAGGRPVSAEYDALTLELEKASALAQHLADLLLDSDADYALHVIAGSITEHHKRIHERADALLAFAKAPAVALKAGFEDERLRLQQQVKGGAR